MRYHLLSTSSSASTPEEPASHPDSKQLRDNSFDSVRDGHTPMRQRKSSTVVLSCAALLGFWLLVKLILSHRQSSALASDDSMKQAAPFAGLDPRYVAALTSADVRPAKPGSKLELADDFRQIHAADQSTLTNAHFHGTSCLSHSVDSVCSIAGSCLPPHADAASTISSNGPCLTWGSGILDLPKLTPSNAPLEATSKWDSPGRFDEHLGWVPRSRDKHWRHFKADQMLQCLQHKRVLIQGDSMMRQLFDRFIQLSRGAPTHLSQFYTGLSLYTIFANGTDEFLMESRSADASLYSRERDTNAGDVLLRVFFNWHSEAAEDFFSVMQPLKDLDIDAAVVGMNYWYPREQDWLQLPPALDDFFVRSNWGGVLSWFATPEQEKINSWVHAGKNGILRAWSDHRREDWHLPVHMLPADYIASAADSQGAPQRNCRHEKDQNACLSDLHFGCFSLTRPGQPAESGLDGIKATLGYDCRDAFNQAVLQTWLNSICPAL